ncbi:MAG TPA: sugar porter family MFS transporter [Acidimicrobiales bacterium]|nr:sugar porter family MFS transporter [Acidimicrobiales bacterium]
MTTNTLDRHSTSEALTWSPYLIGVTAIAAVGGFLFGYDTGVISGALLFIKGQFGGLSAFYQGAVVSGLLLGAAVGALGGGWSADRFGRKRTAVAVAGLFIVGIVVILLAPSVWILIAGRFIVGVGVGAASNTVPLYISEIAPARARGRLVSVNQLMLTIGIVVAYLVDYAFSGSGSWRWMFGIGIVPAAVLGVGTLFLPESPKHLVKTGRFAEARAVLSRVHEEESLEHEIEQVARGESPRPGFRYLLRPSLRKVLFVGMGLAVLQQITGINTVIYYAPTILSSTGITNSSSILSSVLIGSINVVMTIVSMVLIDRIGRRPLLIASLTGMAASLAVLGLAFELSSLSGALQWVTVVCLVAYVASFAIGLGPVFWLLIAEIYPLQARGEAMSMASATNWIANFAVGLTFLLLIQAVGHAGAFWLYAVFGLLGVGFAARFVPETKGRTLEELESPSRPAPQPATAA